MQDRGHPKEIPNGQDIRPGLHGKATVPLGAGVRLGTGVGECLFGVVATNVDGGKWTQKMVVGSYHWREEGKERSKEGRKKLHTSVRRRRAHYTHTHSLSGNENFMRLPRFRCCFLRQGFMCIIHNVCAALLPRPPTHSVCVATHVEYTTLLYYTVVFVPPTTRVCE